MDFVGMLFSEKNRTKGILRVFGLEMGFLGEFAHRGVQAARILKPFKNGRAHFKAGFWTC